MRLDYAISLWNYMHYAGQPSLERIIADVRQEGYGIELWGSCWNEHDLYDEIGRTRLKPALAGMNVSLHTVGRKSGNDFAVHQKQIDAAAYLGAGVLVLHTSDFLMERDGAPNWDMARRVVDYAGEQGVRLALENGQFDFLAEAFTQAPGLFCCIDVGHIYSNGGAMRAYLDAFKDRLIHLHLQNLRPPSLGQTPGSYRDHYTPSPEGIPAADWQLLWATLEEIDFHGAGVFEIHPLNPLETAFQAKTYLHSVVSAPS